MRTFAAAVAVLAMAGLTACQTAESQSVRIDARTRLVVWTEGTAARPTPVSGSADGEPMHRILQNGDGKILFSYDLEVSKSPAGDSYRFVVKPAASGPTFDSVREVTVKAHDEAVRIELMEEPGTGRKIEDVYSLQEIDNQVSRMVDAHIYHVHAFFRHLFHGE